MRKTHLARMVRESVARFSDRPAMCYQENGSWQSISYLQLGEKLDALAKALLEKGLVEKDMVGIFAENRPEWTIADLSILSIRCVSVPIYATNTAEQALYIINDAGIKLIFVGDQQQYDKIISVRDKAPQLKTIVALDPAINLGDKDSVHFDDFLATGKASARDQELQQHLELGRLDDFATLIYTSGTTGDPKGAILTHGNMTHQFYALDERFQFGPEDRSLCFLPLSHSYERAWTFYVLRGGAANYYLANPRQIVEMMPAINPTAMVSVPRLYEKIYSTANEKLETGSKLQKAIFKWAIKVGFEYHTREHALETIGPRLAFRHIIADRLVLSKIRNIVGGRKNFFSAGGAPLAREIEEFFFAAGLLVCQGYGLTETAPMLTCNAPGSFRFGTVGKTILNCEFRTAPDGELQVRGDNIMQGYYNKPEETAAAFDDGWFRTGDVGYVDDQGFVHITGRIKDLIITAQGKNIAPLRIETLVGQDHYIDQIALIGDKRKYLSALIVPAFNELENFARENRIAFSSHKDLVEHPEVMDFYRYRIDQASKPLANYEKIKNFKLMEKEFTQENGEVTPTMKIKRHIISDRYKDVIDSMYA